MNLASLSAGNLIAGIVFSGIGFVAFSYGKKNGRYNTMAWGGALMVYPYFTPTTALTCLVGAALTAGLYFFRD